MGVTYFDIISEYVVIGNLQAGNAGQFAFSLLYLQQIIFSGIRNFTKFVQFGIYSVSNHASFVDQQGRIILNFFGYFVTNGCAQVELLTDTAQALVICIQAGIFDGLNSL